MKKKATILLVDDDESILESFGELLRLERFNVLLANTGSKAVELIEENNIDIILADHKLPDKSGIDLYNIIKTKYPDVKFVLITGFIADEAANCAKDAGIDKLLVKPINIEETLEYINSLIG